MADRNECDINVQYAQQVMCLTHDSTAGIVWLTNEHHQTNKSCAKT